MIRGLEVSVGRRMGLEVESVTNSQCTDQLYLGEGASIKAPRGGDLESFCVGEPQHICVSLCPATDSTRTEALLTSYCLCLHLAVAFYPVRSFVTN